MQGAGTQSNVLQPEVAQLQRRCPQPHQVTKSSQLDRTKAFVRLSLQLITQHTPEHVFAEGQIKLSRQHAQAGQGLFESTFTALMGEGVVKPLAAIVVPGWQYVSLPVLAKLTPRLVLRRIAGKIV